MRVRRELATLVRLGAASPEQRRNSVPVAVPVDAAYTLAGIATSLFAIRPWELPSSEQERFDATAGKIHTEEIEHVRHVLDMARKLVPALSTGAAESGELVL